MHRVELQRTVQVARMSQAHASHPETSALVGTLCVPGKQKKVMWEKRRLLGCIVGESGLPWLRSMDPGGRAPPTQPPGFVSPLA